MTRLGELSGAVRLGLGIVLGGVLFVVFPADWGVPERAALAWAVGVDAFLAMIVIAIGGAVPDRLRVLARQRDAGRWLIFVVIILAATASLVSVGALLHKVPNEPTQQIAGRVALVGFVIVTSWLLIHTVFAVHYGHSYYADGPDPGNDDRAGLDFPGDAPTPDFWDFLYFSLVIGMTCQVSDVGITGRHLRHLATIHGVLSFFFNTVILALTINLVVNTL